MAKEDYIPPKKKVNLCEYEFHSPIKGVCKSYGIWKRRKTNSISPMVYFQKPKHVSEEDFVAFVKSLQFLIKE